MEQQFYDEYSPQAKLRDEVWVDQDTGLIHFQSTQDVTELREECKAQYNESGSHPHWGDGRLVARIPTSKWWELYSLGITRDRKAFRAWMNDFHNRDFRTTHGVL